jgi:hypothetical protein
MIMRTTIIAGAIVLVAAGAGAAAVDATWNDKQPARQSATDQIDTTKLAQSPTGPGSSSPNASSPNASSPSAAPSSTNSSPQQASQQAVQTPTVQPSQHTTQNPLVNPSAAGTQMGWRGYGSSSLAVGETPGHGRDSSVTPGAGQISVPASVSPSAGEARTVVQARLRLRQLGFNRIHNLHRSGKGWVATARRDRRNVQVQLDENGMLVGEHQAER